MPLESQLKYGDKLHLNVGELYLLNTQLVIRFLGKCGYGAVDPHYAEETIKKLEKRHVQYICQYTPGMEANDVEEGMDTEQLLKPVAK